LGKCRVILREPQRLKNLLGVREILRLLGLPSNELGEYARVSMSSGTE